MATPAEKSSAADSAGQTARESGEEEPEGTRRDRLLGELGKRYRLDVELEHYDAEAVSSETLSLGFTTVLAQQHALSATVQLGDSDLEKDSTEGFGDTVLSYSWSGGIPIQASPWLPDTFGPGISLLVPTGDRDDGLGFDSWVAIPAIGGFWDPTPELFLLPGLAYAHSISEGEEIRPVRLVTASVTLLWVNRSAFWLSYVPKVDRDLETAQNTVRHELAIGYRFSHHFSGSLGYEAVLVGAVGDAAGLLGTRERSFDFILNVSF